MNEDHGESVLAYAHYYCGRPDAKAATLLDATDKGFLINVDGEEMWLAYPQECKAKVRSPVFVVQVNRSTSNLRIYQQA